MAAVFSCNEASLDYQRFMRQLLAAKTLAVEHGDFSANVSEHMRMRRWVVRIEFFFLFLIKFKSPQGRLSVKISIFGFQNKNTKS